MAERARPSLPKPDRFNPLDPAAIGTILRERLEQQEPQDFPPATFLGAGLYALYYVGRQVAEYRPLSEAYEQDDLHIPVYVGKAEAGNSSYGYEPNYDAKKLWDRIVKHAASVFEVQHSDQGNLRTEDFRVRYLSLEDAWIVLGERALLRAYRPVLWSTIVNGFGSNPPGTARTNARSVWDTMHPGRERAGLLPNRGLTLNEMRMRIQQGIEISLMQDELERDKALDRLKNERPPVIWAPAKRGDPDRRMCVSDERRFLAEIERLGVEAPEYRLVSAAELPLEDEG